MLKVTFFGLLTVALVGCGSGGDGGESKSTSSMSSQMSQSSSSTGGIANCTIMLSTISLAVGDKCNLTKEDAASFGNSPGLIECAENHKITYNGNVFQSGNNNLSFNGLKLKCGA